MQNLYKKVISAVAAMSLVLVSAPVFNSVEASAYFSPSMTADKQVAKAGEVVTYTLTIKGIRDSHSVHTGISFAGPVEYVAGSATATKGSNVVSLGDSFVENHTFRNLGVLKQGQTLTVSYKAKVKAGATHNALTEAKATIQSRDANNKVKQTADCTAKVRVQAFVAAPKYHPTKSVDKTQAKPGDVLTYTLTLKNTGNVVLNDVLFFDYIPANTTYVANSAVISWDGASKKANENWVNTGINFGQVKVGQTVKLVFKVKVDSSLTKNVRIQNVGQFKTNELPKWVQCAAFTDVIVEQKPTPTPTVVKPTPTPTVVVPTPTPTQPEPTKTPEVLPATGPGVAVVLSLTGVVGALISRKFFA